MRLGITWENTSLKNGPLTFKWTGQKLDVSAKARKQRMFRKLEVAGAATRLVGISVDGLAMVVEEGELIAAVLLRVRPYTARYTPVSGSARAPFCMMGVCFECLIEINGETSTRSCMARAREGMVIRRQKERPDPTAEVRT